MPGVKARHRIRMVIGVLEDSALFALVTINWPGNLRRFRCLTIRLPLPVSAEADGPGLARLEGGRGGGKSDEPLSRRRYRRIGTPPEDAGAYEYLDLLVHRVPVDGVN